MLWLAGLLSSGACLGDFESKPAYEEEEFLCEASEADKWNAAVEACRSAFLNDPSSCGGVMSLSGSLLGDPLRSTTDLRGSIFRIVSLAEGPTLARVDTTGVTPYFNATLSFSDIGGAALDVSIPPRTVTITDQVDMVMYEGDTSGTLTLRANDGVATRTFSAKSGTISFSIQQRDQLAGSFDARFAGERDAVRGCFHLFAQSTRTGEL